MKAAILLTVFNRKCVTINGLKLLCKAIENYPLCEFDIFMTDDGSTDGTSDLVKEHFPQVHIISGDGNLFWSGGMRLAWNVANSYSDYDYYIWFNDDAELYEDAISILFKAASNFGSPTIICGAFEDHLGKVSYGGKTKKWKLIEPKHDEFQRVYWMNGNLVLIPAAVYNKIGVIDKIYIHGTGDYDYGRRAENAGFELRLTDTYVGLTERHDNNIAPMFDKNKPLKKRLAILHSPRYNPVINFKFCVRHIGIVKAICSLLKVYIRVIICF